MQYFYYWLLNIDQYFHERRARSQEKPNFPGIFNIKWMTSDLNEVGWSHFYNVSQTFWWVADRLIKQPLFSGGHLINKSMSVANYNYLLYHNFSSLFFIIQWFYDYFKVWNIFVCLAQKPKDGITDIGFLLSCSFFC